MRRGKQKREHKTVAVANEQTSSITLSSSNNCLELKVDQGGLNSVHSFYKRYILSIY
jgi:hypothetical protein